MTQFRSVRNQIVRLLHTHFSVQVIPGDEDMDVPPYPFVVYNITTDYVRRGQDYITYEQAENGDTVQTYENTVSARYSFNIHSDSRDEAMDLAEQLIVFFDRTGRSLLSDSGIAVIEITNIQDRSVQITDHYERRFGFDVRIRYTHRTQDVSETIETADVQGDPII